MVVELPKIKKNDGGHTPFGVDIDPNKDLVHNTHEDGSYDAYYKGSKMDYGDYISEIESRFHRKKKGKSFSSSIGTFSGVSFNENGKIIKSS